MIIIVSIVVVVVAVVVDPVAVVLITTIIMISSSSIAILITMIEGITFAPPEPLSSLVSSSLSYAHCCCFAFVTMSLPAPSNPLMHKRNGFGERATCAFCGSDLF